MKVIDRFAKPIEVGSLVVWNLPYDFVWLVTDIKPVLTPDAPAGVVAVTLTATAPNSLCKVNSPVVEMIVVGQQPKDGQPSLTPIGETPSETPTPVTEESNG